MSSQQTRHKMVHGVPAVWSSKGNRLLVASAIYHLPRVYWRNHCGKHVIKGQRARMSLFGVGTILDVEKGGDGSCSNAHPCQSTKRVHPTLPRTTTTFLALRPLSAIAEGDGLSFPTETTNAPFLKGLAVSPSRLPTPLLIVLRRYWRRGDHTACADAFWKYWPGVRGHHPGGAVESAGERRENDLSPGGDAERGFGDGWAWEAWHGEDADEAAGILEAAASCFVGLGRSVV